MTLEEKLTRELALTRKVNLGMLVATNVFWVALTKHFVKKGLANLTALGEKREADYKQVQYFLTRLEQEGVDISKILDEFDFIAMAEMERKSEES